MKRAPLLATLVVVGFVGAARAGGPLNFSFTSDGGTIENNSINVFHQEMGLPGEPDPFIPFIASLELEINGVQYQSWDDLDIILISPLGDSIEIMLDRGMGFSNLSGPPVDLTFSDLGSAAVPASGPVATGTYLPHGLDTGVDSGFGTFVGGSGGTDNWFLIVIDDNGNPGGGSFDNWVLRGTIPEPATLSLLALGAVALIRRTRRQRA